MLMSAFQLVDIIILTISRVVLTSSHGALFTSSHGALDMCVGMLKISASSDVVESKADGKTSTRAQYSSLVMKATSAQ